MSDANRLKFQKRLREIELRHGGRASPYVRFEERDGLLVPVRRVRVRRSMPLRGFILVLAGFLLFKGFLLTHLGPITYADRVSSLGQGNAVEQVGAWVMRADPITLWISDLIKPFL